MTFCGDMSKSMTVPGYVLLFLRMRNKKWDDFSVPGISLNEALGQFHPQSYMARNLL